MRTLWRLTRRFVGAVRALLSGGVLLVIVALLMFNFATLAFAPLSAAVSAMLARAVGVETVAGRQSSRLAAAESRLATAERRLVAAERRLARQSDELAALRHVRYRGKTRTARDAVADTADRIARRTATATARNVAAIPGEALPLFGIAVIAGATAWELADACALMQDVHELNVAFDPSRASDPARHEACGVEVPTTAEIWQRIASDPAAGLAAQPDAYGDLPAFHEPGWWDWSMSWFQSEVPLAR